MIEKIAAYAFASFLLTIIVPVITGCFLYSHVGKRGLEAVWEAYWKMIIHIQWIIILVLILSLSYLKLR